MAPASFSRSLQRPARRFRAGALLPGWIACGCALLLGACAKTEPSAGSEAQAAAVVSVQAPRSANVQVGEALTAELMVQGVSCASCSLAIRNELQKLEGIVAIREGDVKTHLLVDFDGQRISAEQLLDAVHRAGYDAEVLVHATKS